MANVYRYQASLKSKTDGRPFTWYIKTPSTFSLSQLKGILEERCDCTVHQLTLIETFDLPALPDSERVYNMSYAGHFTIYDGGTPYTVDVSRVIVPMYNLPFESLYEASWKDLEDYFKKIYGETFVLTYAQMVQSN